MTDPELPVNAKLYQRHINDSSYLLGALLASWVPNQGEGPALARKRGQTIDSIESEMELLQEKLDACKGIAEAAAFIRENASKAGFQIDVVTIKRLERAVFGEVEESIDTIAVLEEKRRVYWEAERKEVNRCYERSV